VLPSFSGRSSETRCRDAARVGVNQRAIAYLDNFERSRFVDGRLYWSELTDNGEVRHAREPHTSVWKRLGVAILARLPIVWLL